MCYLALFCTERRVQPFALHAPTRAPARSIMLCSLCTLELYQSYCRHGMRFTITVDGRCSPHQVRILRAGLTCNHLRPLYIGSTTTSKRRFIQLHPSYKHILQTDFHRRTERSVVVPWRGHSPTDSESSPDRNHSALLITVSIVCAFYSASHTINPHPMQLKRPRC